MNKCVFGGLCGGFGPNWFFLMLVVWFGLDGKTKSTN